MIKQILSLALLAGGLNYHHTNDDQAFLALLAETRVMRMAGMPKIELPPGVKLPKGPGTEFMSGKPTRNLNIRLWSPGIAAKDAWASVAPPDGLKQGKKLDLDLFRPEAGKGEGGGEQGEGPGSNPNYTIKIYWGSSKTVREGQPKVITMGSLSPEQKAVIAEKSKQMRSGASYFYKPDWTTGYWPSKKQPGMIDDAASLVGKYALTTNYTGNVEIEAPSDVDFLAGYNLTSPGLEKKPDLMQSLGFVWDSVPHCLGQYASIMGTIGNDTLILWTSSETYVEGMTMPQDYLQMSEVKDYVSKTVFMPGDKTSVDVPAGIFADVDFAMLNMAGYGPGAALDKGQPLPRIQTKSTLMVMLGGKKMNFGGGGGGR